MLPFNNLQITIERAHETVTREGKQAAANEILLFLDKFAWDYQGLNESTIKHHKAAIVTFKSWISQRIAPRAFKPTQ